MGVSVNQIINIDDKSVEVRTTECHGCDGYNKKCIPLGNTNGGNTYVCVKCFKKIAEGLEG